MRPLAAVRDERGTILPWMLVTLVLLVFLGGLSLDLWLGFAQRRLLAGTVDAAAVAGASAIDEEAFRNSGDVRLDPTLAQRRAREYIASSPAAGVLDDVVVRATATQVQVTAGAALSLTLSRVLLADTAPLRVEVRAVAEPKIST